MSKTVIALILTALTGCQAVGPDYEPPQATLPDSWGVRQNSDTLPIEWWVIFDDPRLSSLIQRATTNNLNLLVKALNRYVLPTSTVQVWLACEQQIAVYLKNHFINERMIPKTPLFAKGY